MQGKHSKGGIIIILIIQRMGELFCSLIWITENKKFLIGNPGIPGKVCSQRRLGQTIVET